MQRASVSKKNVYENYYKQEQLAIIAKQSGQSKFSFDSKNISLNQSAGGSSIELGDSAKIRIESRRLGVINEEEPE